VQVPAERLEQAKRTAEVWTEKDHGIWEMRGPKRDFTASKVAAWTVIDRWVRLIDKRGLKEDRGPWHQLRQRIFDAVSKNGGHLASNLGVVELTLALHYVYDFGPYPAGPDRLLWDVGHQSYPHKLLTGRAHLFDKLRKKGSVSGFPSPEESPYDLFAVGHAGTAISTAVGMARGDGHLKRDNHVVAVVGDASIVNGLAFEGLNNAGTVKRQLLIILNDNGMSISKPQGAFSHYLERVRVSTTYDEFKRFSEKIVHQLPTRVGHAIEHAWESFCSSRFSQPRDAQIAATVSTTPVLGFMRAAFMRTSDACHSEGSGSDPRDLGE
jgi:1-deoxy-D-xylulose-5-phosphate synthase